MPKCPIGWQNTLNCPLGWLKHDKLPSWEPKHVLKCPLGSQNALKCPSFRPSRSKSLRTPLTENQNVVLKEIEKALKDMKTNLDTEVGILCARMEKMEQKISEKEL